MVWLLRHPPSLPAWKFAGLLLFSLGLLTGCLPLPAAVQKLPTPQPALLSTLPTPTIGTATLPPTYTPSPQPTNTPDPTPTLTPSPTATVTATAMPLDLAHLASIGLGNSPRLELLARIQPGNPAGGYSGGFAFSPDSLFLAISVNSAVWIWDLNLGQRVKILNLPANTVGGAGPIFSPDGKQIARISGRNQIYVWSVETGEVLQILQGGPQTQSIVSLAYTPAGVRPARLAATGIVSGKPGMIFWDVTTGALLTEEESTAPDINPFVISPNGRLLIQAGHEGVLRFWDPATGKHLADQYIYACPDSLAGLVFAPNSLVLAFQCDGMANAAARIFLYMPRYYRPGDLVLQRVLKSELPGSGLLAFNKESALLAVSAGAPARQVAFWNAITGTPLTVLPTRPADLRQIAFSPDGKLLALRLSDAALELWGAPR